MKRFWILVFPLLSACGRLDTLLYTPTLTPEDWLRIQPFGEIQLGSMRVLIAQPSTTAIVYLLGLITIGAGFYFLRIQAGQRSRQWWGIALLLWGLGALLAGTSYEAFSYQIKCAGRPACLWTSWWEIAYLFVSAASIDAMLVAHAWACTTGKWRTIFIRYAYLKTALYALILLVGTLVPVRFLISFELLLIISAPNILLFFIHNNLRYRQHHRSMDLALLGAWVWLALTIAAYFLYLISGLTDRLWAQGLWFSENDVLHIGLILWMLYLVAVVAHRLMDAPEFPTQTPHRS